MVREVSKLMLQCYLKSCSLPLESSIANRSKGVASLVVLYVLGFMIFFLCLLAISFKPIGACPPYLVSCFFLSFVLDFIT